MVNPPVLVWDKITVFLAKFNCHRRDVCWRLYDGMEVQDRLLQLSAEGKGCLKGYRDAGAKIDEEECYNKQLKLHKEIPLPPNPRLFYDPMFEFATQLLDLGAYCSICGKRGALRLCVGCKWEASCSAEH